MSRAPFVVINFKYSTVTINEYEKLYYDHTKIVIFNVPLHYRPFLVYACIILPPSTYHACKPTSDKEDKMEHLHLLATFFIQVLIFKTCSMINPYNRIQIVTEIYELTGFQQTHT